MVAHNTGGSLPDPITTPLNVDASFVHRIDLAGGETFDVHDRVTGRTYIHVTSGSGTQITSPDGGQVSITSNPINSVPSIAVDGDDISVFLKAGRKLQVFDSSFAAIFEVHDDGSLHGKSGKSLTFDL